MQQRIKEKERREGGSKFFSLKHLLNMGMDEYVHKWQVAVRVEM